MTFWRFFHLRLRHLFLRHLRIGVEALHTSALPALLELFVVEAQCAQMLIVLHVLHCFTFACVISG